jgi:hypothetical protein
MGPAHASSAAALAGEDPSATAFLSMSPTMQWLQVSSAASGALWFAASLSTLQCTCRLRLLCASGFWQMVWGKLHFPCMPRATAIVSNFKLRCQLEDHCKSTAIPVPCRWHPKPAVARGPHFRVQRLVTGAHVNLCKSRHALDNTLMLQDIAPTIRTPLLQWRAALCR